MKYHDEMRILADLGTFTQSDFADATGTTTTWASKLFTRLINMRYIHCVRVGHSWLYALTERGSRLVAALPPLDPDERVLPIDWGDVPPVGVCTHGDLITHSWKEERGYGALFMHNETRCAECGEVVSYSVWDMQED